MCATNGRCCCSPVLLVWTIVILVAIFGLGFLGGGIPALVVPSVTRSHQIDEVEGAAKAWTASGRNSFNSFNGYVSLSVGPAAVFACANSTYAQTLKLTPSACPRDTYVDGTDRFQSLPQLAYCVAVKYNIFVQCDLQATFLAVQPGATANSTLIQLPDIVYSTPGSLDIAMFDIGGPNRCIGKNKCYGSDWNRCANKCRDKYGGALQCGGIKCYVQNVHISNIAVKVAYNQGTNTYALDSSQPQMDGKSADGANILPNGYTYYPKPNFASNSGPRWQYEALSLTQPIDLTLTVRSSSDPYLRYMAVTQGSGYFADTKSFKGLGIALIVIGGVILLGDLLFALFVVYAGGVYRREKAQPQSCFKALAWSLARSMYGPTLAEQQAQQMQLQNQMHGQAMQPRYQYPAAYPPGAPGAQGYTAYPPGVYPPTAYPPGGYSPTAYPPGAYPPTAYPPGGYPPTAYPQSQPPAGAPGPPHQQYPAQPQYGAAPQQ